MKKQMQRTIELSVPSKKKVKEKKSTPYLILIFKFFVTGL